MFALGSSTTSSKCFSLWRDFMSSFNAGKMPLTLWWYVDKTMVPCCRWYPRDLEQNWHQRRDLTERKREHTQCVKAAAGQLTGGVRVVHNARKTLVCSEYLCEWALRHFGCARPSQHSIIRQNESRQYNPPQSHCNPKCQFYFGESPMVNSNLKILNYQLLLGGYLVW